MKIAFITIAMLGISIIVTQMMYTSICNYKDIEADLLKGKK